MNRTFFFPPKFALFQYSSISWFYVIKIDTQMYAFYQGFVLCNLYKKMKILGQKKVFKIFLGSIEHCD